jgi:hypothetical protein
MMQVVQPQYIIWKNFKDYVSFELILFVYMILYLLKNFNFFIYYNIH